MSIEGGRWKKHRGKEYESFSPSEWQPFQQFLNDCRQPVKPHSKSDTNPYLNLTLDEIMDISYFKDRYAEEAELHLQGFKPAQIRRLFRLRDRIISSKKLF